MEQQKKSNRNANVTLFRGICALVYYALLLAAGVYIVYWAYRFSYWLFDPGYMLEPERGQEGIRFMGLIFVLVLLAGIWSFVWMLARYWLSPLFMFRKMQLDGRMEVTSADCPRLFECIGKVAQQVGSPMPRRVYLSPDADSFVSSSIRFGNLFIPARKSLVLGVSPLWVMDEKEFAATLGHELSHLADKRVRVGDLAIIVNNMFVELSRPRGYSREQGSLPARWVVAWGALVCIALMRRLAVWHTFFDRWVLRAFMRLSREMEQEADAASCRVAGSEAAVSNLCKRQLVEGRFALYESALRQLLEELKYFSGYWRGYALAEPYLVAYDHVQADWRTRLRDFEFGGIDVYSKLVVKDIWSPHPPFEERLAYCRRMNAGEPSVGNAPAWDLIPEVVKDKLSELRLPPIRQENLDALRKRAPGLKEAFVPMGEEEFSQSLGRIFRDMLVPLHLQPFFSDSFAWFVPAQPDSLAWRVLPPARVFSEENGVKLLKYGAAFYDRDTLQAIADKQLDIKEFFYDGRFYTRCNVPLEEHEAYLDKVFVEAQTVGEDVYRCLVQRGDTEKVEMAYASLIFWREHELYMDFIRDLAGDIRGNIEGILANEGEDMVFESKIIAMREGDFREFLQNMPEELAVVSGNREDFDALKQKAEKPICSDGRLALDELEGFCLAMETACNFMAGVRRKAVSYLVQEAERIL